MVIEFQTVRQGGTQEWEFPLTIHRRSSAVRRAVKMHYPGCRACTAHIQDAYGRVGILTILSRARQVAPSTASSRTPRERISRTVMSGQCFKGSARGGLRLSRRVSRG